MPKCLTRNCFKLATVKGEWYVSPNSARNLETVFFCERCNSKIGESRTRSQYFINVQPVLPSRELEDIEKELWGG